MSGTLRTFQRAGCDEELVTLTCPKGTTISIQIAQYGRSGASPTTLCATASPSASSPSGKRGSSSASITAYQYQHHHTTPTNFTCVWPSALQTVVEACQKKRQCKFNPSTQTFGGDPCPGVRKYVEVAYKCRPFEFLSEVACENDKIQLQCEVNHRVAVFSASYGRTEYESVHCPQPEGVAEESCLVSFATEAVMLVCHGKRRCTLTADAATFGNPCRPASRMYLKVVYTCVPRTVLKEKYDTAPEEDEQDTTAPFEEPSEDYDRSTTIDQEFYQESFAHPPVTKIEVNRYNNYSRISPQVTSTGTPSHRKTKDLETTTVSYTNLTPSATIIQNTKRTKKIRYHQKIMTSHDAANTITNTKLNSEQKSFVTSTNTNDQNMLGDEFSKIHATSSSTNSDERQQLSKITSGVIAISLFVSQNQERFYLIIIISVSICIVIVLGLLGAHFIMSRRQQNQEDKYQNNAPEHTMPREFVDDISDINDDIALGTPLPITTANTLPRSGATYVPATQTAVSTTSPIIKHPRTGENVFAVSTFGIDERHHHIHHPPPGSHVGYVIPPPDGYQTFQRRPEDIPRGLAHGPDSHYFYG